MKLLGISKNGRALRLRPESEDDLWVLYNIIRQGDIVRSRTTRELKTRSGSKRKPMTMAIRVEWTEYQPFTTRLRIHGKIVEAPREYDLIGQRHTINLEIGDEVLIFKEEGWEQYDFKRIKEACRRSSVSLLTVAIDEDEACIALVRDYGIKVMAEIDLNLPGKYDVAGREHELKRKLSHIAKVVEALVNEYKPNAVIVAGPGVIKEMLKNKLSEHNIKPYVENVSTGGIKGVHEVIKRGFTLKVLKDMRIVEEERIMEEIMRTLAVDEGRVAFGLEEVETAVMMSAARKLFIISELVRAQDEELRRRVEALLREAERKGAQVRIFDSFHDTYLQLKNLGGVVAIMSYKLPLKEIMKGQKSSEQEE